MTKIFSILVISTLWIGHTQAKQTDLKMIAGTISFEPTVNEKKAIQIGHYLAKNKDAHRIYIRQYKSKDIWAVSIEWTHSGSQKSFQKTVKKIKNSIENQFGKDIIKGNNLASSVTWIKK